MKLGILGGTFNPPHLAHLRLAEEVAQQFALERILFIPCHIPPHKSVSGIAPSEDRLEMTRRACTGNPVFNVSDMEIEARGLSYTVKTLETFAARKDVETFFIIGTDSLREIHTWKDNDRLFSLSHFIVVSRPGIEFASAWKELPDRLRAQFRESAEGLVHSASTRLIATPVQGLNISSTQIRELLRQGRSIRYLVTESVRSYIMDNRLYRNQ